MLLITGANGQLGRMVVDEVLRRRPDGPLAVSVREPERAGDLAALGVEVRHGDFDDPSTLADAFRGADRMLLISTPVPDAQARVDQFRPVVAAAADAGVGHIVYTGAHAHDRFDAPLFGAHLAIEQMVRDTGATWTGLRNAIYAEVIAGEVLGAIAAGELAAPAADAEVAPVLRRDLAAATATVLLEDGHENRAYELTGADTISWPELAEIATERAGTPIAYRPIDDAEAAQRLGAAGLPSPVVDTMLSFYEAYRAGWCGTPTGDLARLSGRATPAAEAILAVLDGAAS